jgi:dTDP-4-dehydrorhamnose reductase
MKTILITGAKGQLGSELSRLIPSGKALPLARNNLDITREDMVLDFCQNHTPGVIVNCAAYTYVDKAEDESEAAFAVNEQGPRNLALAAQALDIPLVHVSTDFVFDGIKPGLYKEDDPTGPLGVYGRSKLAGEKAILATHEKSLIIRTSWVYSAFGKNFVKTILKIGGEKGHLRVVADQSGSPTHARDLAGAIVRIMPDIQRGFGQIFHYSNLGMTSWFDFATAIVRMAGISCSVEPIETHEYPTPSRRPVNSALSTGKIRRTFCLDIPYWQDSLKKCLEEIELTCL